MLAHLPRAHGSGPRLRGRASHCDGRIGRIRLAIEVRRRPAVTALAITALATCLLLGCGYSFTPSRLPSHIHTVAIPVFENQTAEPALAEEVTTQVTREFVRDNKLKVVPESRADSGIYGRIIRYENRVFGYNARAQTEEYEVVIEVLVEFKDLVKRKPLWKEESMIGRTTYFVIETTGQEAKDEVSGRAEAILRLAEDILNRTVRSWS